MSARQVKCDYCKQPAVLVGGIAIYPHRRDLKAMWFWRCVSCSAYVGCHPPGNGDGTKPLGRLANEELRRLKSLAHAAFDPLWKVGCMKRGDAYYWLSKATGIPLERCHVGMMNETECELVCSTIMKAELDGSLPVKLPAPTGEATENVVRMSAFAKRLRRR